LTEYGVNAGSLSEERVSAILNEFYLKIDSQLSKLDGANMRALPVPIERVEDCSGYQLHMYEGAFHRVPADWRFPKCGTLDLWRMWWVGDTERQVPPLKILKINDVKHIDMKPLSGIEKTRKVGPNKDNRRMVTKCLTDMRFICKFLTNIVTLMGKLECVVTLSAVDRMFSAFADFVLNKDRDAQKSWTSVVRELRKKEVAIKIEEIATSTGNKGT
jgi:hypothetical protein